MSGVVVVVSGFPRQSETFAIGELAALAERGVLQAVFATQTGDGLPPHDDAVRLADWVTVLPPGDEIAQARAMARSLRGRPLRGIHGYFAHRPARVAQLASQALDVPFTFSVHAKDARKVAPDELRRRADGAAGVITCNVDTQRELERMGVSASLRPHGVNLTRFMPGPWRPELPLRLLAVGRLVRKKGFHVLLEALSLVHVPWTLRVVGEGPERMALMRLAREAGLDSRVVWHGSASHAQLPELYHSAHVVVVPSVVDDDGDRDGLPNVVLEALAAARLVIASDVGAIASAIADRDTGRLVAPGDPVALAEVLDETAIAPAHETAAMAARGRWLVEERFDVTRCTSAFIDTLAGCYA